MFRQEDYEFVYKIVLIGDCSVGKTSYLNRFMHNTFGQVSATMGVDYKTKIVTFQSGKNVKVTIWDTSGEEKYKALTSAHFNGAAGVLLLFSIDEQKSFQNCLSWLKTVKDNTDEVNSDLTLRVASFCSLEARAISSKRILQREWSAKI